MKTKKKNWNYLLIIIVALFVLSCSGKKNDEPIITYTTNDLEGVWIGLFNVKPSGSDTTYSMSVTMTFGPNGTFLSMHPSPVYISITGNLNVGNNGSITGTITTKHITYGPHTETTTMNWTGSYFESKSKIIIGMSWPWQNDSGAFGTFVLTGYLNKQ